MGQRWWDRPTLPYLMLVASPLLIAPSSFIILLFIPGCGEVIPGEPLGSTDGWEPGYFEIALLPALAELLPFLWLASGTPRVRRAARVAGLMGLARYAFPQAFTLMAVLEVFSEGYFGVPECPISSFVVALFLIPTMLILWLVSTLVVAVILFRD